MEIKRTTIATLIALSVVSGGAQAQFSLDKLLGGDKKEEKKDQEVDISKMDLKSPVEQMAQKDISKSKSVGEVLGGIIAGYACYKKFGDSLTGKVAIPACILAGAKLGGPLGEYVGEAIAIRRLKYANEYEFLESEIEASEKALTTREKELKETKSQITQSSKRINELKGNETLTKEQIKEAKALKKETKERLEENKLLEERYQQTLDYLEGTLEDSKENIAGLKEKKKETQGKYEDLKKKRDSLAVQLAAVQQQTTQLEQDHTILENMIGA